MYWNVRFIYCEVKIILMKYQMYSQGLQDSFKIGGLGEIQSDFISLQF